jgi:ABC toxin N-terminal region/Putative peptidoglycan binding domain
VQLRSRFQLLRKLSVSAEAVHQWATRPVTVETALEVKQTARDVKQTARAKYEDQAQWLTVAKPLRDELREQQRAALVAYLVHAIRIQIPRFEASQPILSIGAHRPAVQELQLKLNMAGATPPLKVDGMFGGQTSRAVRDFQAAHGLDDDGIVGPGTWAALNQINRRLRGPHELYAHFLIDVEMDPCMLTSRIVLANSSVQLFVQRCLLNLEPEVALSPEDAKEWEWMKRYRLWEANRKVFL